MKKIIAVLPGDGIGPEIMASTLQVLKLIEELYCHQFIYKHLLIGGNAYDKYHKHLPNHTINECTTSDAILFGSVGGPVDSINSKKWAHCETNSILALRKLFDFNINIRPIQSYKELKDNSPLNISSIDKGIDIEIFRELSSDIYFGEHREFINNDGIRCATDLAEYDENSIRAIAKKAFERAKCRGKKLISVDKANVLSTSKLWREIVNEEAEKHPTVSLEHMYVDNCAMQMILNPSQFDIILTSNLFGDIISDLASVIPGSIGLVPSISLNKLGFGLYEPSGGSAYSITNKNIANPIAQILSASLMLEYSFHLFDEGKLIRNAIQSALKKGARTQDINRNQQYKSLSTTDFTSFIIDEMKLLFYQELINKEKSKMFL
jgi:3-isopropylmalate dehydrogenase